MSKNQKEFKDQKTLIDKINDYLLKESEISEERKNELKSLKSYYSKSQGECAGLSTIWSHVKQLETRDPKEAESIRKIYDNIYFFNESSALDEKSKADIDNFLKQLRTYQELVGMEDKTGTNPSYVKNNILGTPNKLLLCKDLVSTELGLIDIFNELFSKNKGSEILVSVNKKEYYGHKMAVFQSKNGSISFFEPNSGELKFNTTEEFVETLWNKSKLDNLIYGESEGGLDMVESMIKRFNIEVFNFDIGETFSINTKSSQKGYEDFVNFLARSKINLGYESTIFLNNLLERLKSQEGSLALGNRFTDLCEHVLNKIFNDKDLCDEGKDFLYGYIKKNFEYPKLLNYLFMTKNPNKAIELINELNIDLKEAGNILNKTLELKNDIQDSILNIWDLFSSSEENEKKVLIKLFQASENVSHKTALYLIEKEYATLENMLDNQEVNKDFVTGILTTLNKWQYSTIMEAKREIPQIEKIINHWGTGKKIFHKIVHEYEPLPKEAIGFYKGFNIDLADLQY